MGWIIFGGILALILALLMVPVHITADWNKKLSVKVRYLFIKKTLFPMEKKEEPKEKEEEIKPTEKQTTKKKKKHRLTLEETIDKIIDAVNRYGPGAKMILRNIRVHSLELFWKIAGEDAAACAIRYGKICAFLSTALGFFRNFMRIEKSSFRVYPDFTAEKEDIRVNADVEFNPLIILIGAVRIAVAFVKNIFEEKKTKGKNKKRISAAEKPLKNNTKECA